MERRSSRAGSGPSLFCPDRAHLPLHRKQPGTTWFPIVDGFVYRLLPHDDVEIVTILHDRMLERRAVQRALRSAKSKEPECS
jgi:hypothetical protein